MLWINLIKELFNYFLCSEERDGAGFMEQTDDTWAESLQRLQQNAGIEFGLWLIHSPNLLLLQFRFFLCLPLFLNCSLVLSSATWIKVVLSKLWFFVLWQYFLLRRFRAVEGKLACCFTHAYVMEVQVWRWWVTQDPWFKNHSNLTVAATRKWAASQSPWSKLHIPLPCIDCSWWWDSSSWLSCSWWMRSRAGEGRKGELMSSGSSLQLDGVKPSIKPHPGQDASARVSGVCPSLLRAMHVYLWCCSPQSPETEHLSYLGESFIMQLLSCCFGSNLTHLIDAFSLNPAHQKLVKLVCHWNAPHPLSWIPSRFL